MHVDIDKFKAKTGCTHQVSFDFTVAPFAVTLKHERRRKTLKLDDYLGEPVEKGWLTVLMDWVQEVHKK